MLIKLNKLVNILLDFMMIFYQAAVKNDVEIDVFKITDCVASIG